MNINKKVIVKYAMAFLLRKNKNSFISIHIFN